MQKENKETEKYFEDISLLGVSHFKAPFRALEEISIDEVIRVAQFFPSYIDEEWNDNIMEPITKEEVEDILKAM